jgi:pre-rRNA-processing protein TSR3
VNQRKSEKIPLILKPKIYVYQMKQDDQRKCTAAKLCRLGLAQPIFQKNKIPKKGITLNPKASSVFSPQDKPYLIYGLIAIDCSWKKANETFSKRFRGLNRRLPLLIAANPINYGKISMLSSAEALASALYIADYIEESRKLMSIFKWGLNFLELNKDPLEEYRLSKSPEDIIEIEKEYFKFYR